jgi:AmmeMemoRadiSam system protein A
LLRIARESVVSQLTGTVQALDVPTELPGASGVFVTLKRRGELRGCLGTLECREGLAQEVARCARESSTLDPRFAPVSLDELAEISIEISILGPLEEIDPAVENAFLIGRHGLVVEHGHRRGLLLPQVATEWGWTREQFLRQTCRKASLADDAWQRGARVFRFDAHVFGE